MCCSSQALTLKKMFVRKYKLPAQVGFKFGIVMTSASASDGLIEFNIYNPE